MKTQAWSAYGLGPIEAEVNASRIVGFNEREPETKQPGIPVRDADEKADA